MYDNGKTQPEFPEDCTVEEAKYLAYIYDEGYAEGIAHVELVKRRYALAGAALALIIAYVGAWIGVTIVGALQ